MNIQIDKKEYLTPRDTPPPRVGEELTKFISNTLDLYIFNYTMSCVECDNDLPSRLFYIDGYPVLLYDNKKTSIQKKMIGWLLFIE